MTENLPHIEHLEIMLEKIQQEIKSCKECGCHHCQVKLPEWEEKYLEYYIEVYGDYPL